MRGTIFQKDRFELVMNEIQKIGVKEVYSLGDSHIPFKMDGVRIFSVDLYGEPDIKCDLNGEWNFSNVECIFAGQVIEHILNPTDFIAKCYKALKLGGGFLILTTDNWGFYLWRLQSLLGIVPKIIKHDFLHGGTRHYNVFSVKDIEKLLISNGLNILKFVRAWKIPAPLDWQPVIFVVAQK